MHGQTAHLEEELLLRSTLRLNPVPPPGVNDVIGQGCPLKKHPSHFSNSNADRLP